MPWPNLGTLPLRLALLGQRGIPYLANYEHLPNLLTVPTPATYPATAQQQQHSTAATAAQHSTCSSSSSYSSPSAQSKHPVPSVTPALLHLHHCAYSYFLQHCTWLTL